VRMSFRIAIAGKGGVGKSTIAALLIRALHERSGKVIMAVDADPNSNLGEKLGMKVEHTIGELREDLLKNADNIPAGQSKQEYVELQMKLATVEGEGIDLLTMGRQEGPGCYCFINNILRTFLDMAMDEYDYVVIDNEAGMEHLSRRTTKRMDRLMIVADPTKVGLETALRIKSLASSMGVEVGATALIVNQIKAPLGPELRGIIEKGNFDRTFTLPFDVEVEEFAIRGRSLHELHGSDTLYLQVKELVATLVR